MDASRVWGRQGKELDCKERWVKDLSRWVVEVDKEEADKRLPQKREVVEGQVQWLAKVGGRWQVEGEVGLGLSITIRTKRVDTSLFQLITNVVAGGVRRIVFLSRDGVFSGYDLGCWSGTT